MQLKLLAKIEFKLYNVHIISMEVIMNSLVRAMDKLNIVIKIILALPVLDIVWHFYRLLRSIDRGNVLGIILAVLLIVVGWAFFWIVDIISIILTNRVLWID